jgi:DNA-directed RNA polymerase subunit M/transcription elongation factor TFIIS
MPVKVRCPSCSKVLNVPDSARGKAVKCPGCEERIPVPALGGESKSGANPAVKPKKKAVAASSDSDSFLANLDLEASVDTEARVCGKCGAQLEEEQTECPQCGIDSRTGQLSARVARKRALKGADPNDYYGMVIGDAWRFMLGNLGMAVMSGAITLLLLSIAGGLFGLATILTQMPPRMFSLAFAAGVYLGIPGWYFHLTLETILATLARKTQLRTKFDLVTAMASGVMFTLWSGVYFLPASIVTFFLISLAGPPRGPGDPVQALVILGIVYGPILLLIPFVPPAMAHLASYSSWRGWVLPMMIPMAFKNFGQSLMWGVVFFIGALLFLLVAIGGVFLWASLGATMILPLFMKAAEGANAEQVSYLKGGLAILMFGSLLFVNQFALACGTLFAARGLGQYTFYCKESLDLVTKAPEHVYKRKDIKLDEHGRPITPWYVTVGTILFVIAALAVAGFMIMRTFKA